jgi:hypothetical protein
MKAYGETGRKGKNLRGRDGALSSRQTGSRSRHPSPAILITACFPCRVVEEEKIA